MKLSTARRVIRYPVLQIAQLGIDDDGGVRALEYMVTAGTPEWVDPPKVDLPQADPPPLLGRERNVGILDPFDLWVIVAGIGLAVWGLLGCIGFVEVVKWVLR